MYTFFVLDLGLDIVDRVVALDLQLQGDRLPRQRLDEDLHLACCCFRAEGQSSRWMLEATVVILLYTVASAPNRNSLRE